MPHPANRHNEPVLFKGMYFTEAGLLHEPPILGAECDIAVTHARA
jgi:hypothetical protein